MRLVLSVLLLMLMACGGQPDQSTTEEQVLHRGNGAGPITLDPHKAEDVSTGEVLRDLFEGLTANAADGSLIPGAAERWEVSEDGLSYTFYLRADGRWSNGDPVTAADFEFSLRRIVDPATGSKYATTLSPIKNAAAIIAGKLPATQLGVKALDEQRLQIQLAGPTPYFPQLLSHAITYPVHPASVKAHGAGFTKPGRLVSNGPYQLNEWRLKAYVAIGRNPHYRQVAPINVVFHHTIVDPETELRRFRAGELHLTYTLPSGRREWAEQELPGQLRIGQYFGTYYLALNLEKPPFKGNLKLRQALAMAIDRFALVEYVTGFGETPAFGWVPPGVAGYEQAQMTFATWSPEKRLAEAKRLYTEAGFGPDKPLKFELRYNTSENHRQTMTAIADMWHKALGVQVTLVNEEWKVFVTNVRERKVTQAVRAGWIGDFTDPFTFAELMGSRHEMNASGFVDAGYDALLAEAAKTVDAQQRLRLLAKAEARLLAQQPVIPLYFYSSRHLVAPQVQGFEANPLDHHPSAQLSFRRPPAIP